MQVCRSRKEDCVRDRLAEKHAAFIAGYQIESLKAAVWKDDTKGDELYEAYLRALVTEARCGRSNSGLRPSDESSGE